VDKEQFIDRYLEKIKDLDIDTERQTFLDSQIKNKKSEEIAKYLSSVSSVESGGITAISGFYYQFLVTIEYILEMLEGKWDYVIMEHHDDILVGKENKIRFIQVKTSQKVKVDASAKPASDLYSRSTKDVNGIKLKKNNSWVDKLISNAELVPNSSEFKTEFQLYSSYHFIKTNNYNFDIYTDNKEYNLKIPQEDNLLKKISEPAVNKIGDSYNYEDSCGESISNLLSRLHIHTGISLNKIEVFEHDLCMKLNNWLFKEIGPGITTQIEDLHMLIGNLCSKCTYKNNPELLLITRESVDMILTEIRNSSISAASTAANKHDSLRIIDRVFEDLLREVEGSTHFDFIKDKFFSYKEYLKSWVTSGKSIRGLLERYIDGTIRTNVYTKLGETNREIRLQNLFYVVLMLIIGRNSFLEFTNNNGLLSKKCSTTKEIFSFLNLEKQGKLQNGLNKLESIIKSGDLEEQLFLMDKELHVVIQNYNDFTFTSSLKWKYKNENEEKYGIENIDKLNKVNLEINIIPGEILKAEFLTYKDEETNLQKSLQEVWANYNIGGMI
jgi:hypothetical protein